MESKTPQFDALLDEILEKLVPHKRVCKWQGQHKYCEGEFNITKEDIEFLKMLRVPAPNYCPTCRRIRRFTHLNFFRLFKRKCNAVDHNEMMISILPEECPFPVYDYKYFVGDDFDPFSFGVKYKKGDSPMETLLQLRRGFPMPSFLNRDLLSVNSEYSNSGHDIKNGYYVTSCYHSEDIWYSGFLNKSRNIMDSQIVLDSELVYNSVDSEYLYKSSFTYFSSHCIDSMFLFDCRNCQDCFGCVNLRNKRYCVFNEQFSKEDYESFLSSIKPFSRETISIYEEKFWELVKKLPMNGSRNSNSINSYGINLKNSKDLYDVFDSKNAENIRHAEGPIGNKDSMDFLYSGGNSSRVYGTINIGSHSNEVRFSVSSKTCTNCEFIFNSKNLNNCFMCFGLQNKSYCILNNQYSPDEYYKIIDEIKSEMLERGEYADGLGMEFSAQAYNFSVGQFAFPLDDKEIEKFGGFVAKEPKTNAEGIEIISKDKLPKTIKEVTDEILNKAIECEITGKPFRIIASELEFYKRMDIPLPTIHPTVRKTYREKV
ncbi:MAG: hypothetical protein UR85_C0004G0108 [Candidatus Nomurabacteria bacterium GW2011_GWF2_35_66]|nr:MAG: hypothetical protein UR85_C0004G0108 [Candidatus Nomurabacteria bacterium GW2011_GWF2_35_66]